MDFDKERDKKKWGNKDCWYLWETVTWKSKRWTVEKSLKTEKKTKKKKKKKDKKKKRGQKKKNTNEANDLKKVLGLNTDKEKSKMKFKIIWRASNLTFRCFQTKVI